MNPAFLLGIAFNIAYWHKKYHSGTICNGVNNGQTSNALSGCDKEIIPKFICNIININIIYINNIKSFNNKKPLFGNKFLWE